MKIGINGFGRIGRLVLRSALARGVDLDIVAINDRGDASINAHLFQFDSTYGPFSGHVRAEDNRIIIDGRSIAIVSHLIPLDIPWRSFGVESHDEDRGQEFSEPVHTAITTLIKVIHRAALASLDGLSSSPYIAWET